MDLLVYSTKRYDRDTFGSANEALDAIATTTLQNVADLATGTATPNEVL